VIIHSTNEAAARSTWGRRSSSRPTATARDLHDRRSAEADANAGKISFTSPIGRALMGRKAGEKIRVEIPQGSMDFLVLKVR